METGSDVGDGVVKRMVEVEEKMDQMNGDELEKAKVP